MSCRYIAENSKWLNVEVKTYFKQEIIRDKKYRASFVNDSCTVCNDPNSVGHHVIYRNSGVGTKPCDSFLIALCTHCHAERHSMSEEGFWNIHGFTIDEVIRMAKNRYKQYLEGKLEWQIMNI